MNLDDFLPRTPAEKVNVFAHYYRAEMQRAISWRDRLDRTTNWAIAATAGILSVSLNQPDKHHGVLIFGMALVFLLLIIESRRYRYFDVYRRRVRVFETGYYAQIMKPSEMPPDREWLEEIADSLRAPALTAELAGSHGASAATKLLLDLPYSASSEKSVGIRANSFG